MSGMLLAISRRGKRELTLEGTVECGFGFIPHLQCDLQDRMLSRLEHSPRKLQAPLPFQVHAPHKLRLEMVNTGLRDVRVEETGEGMKYKSGKQFWDWVTGSNPIVGMILGQLNLKQDQIATIQMAADHLIRERAAGHDTAVLISPINIGVGTK